MRPRFAILGLAGLSGLATASAIPDANAGLRVRDATPLTTRQLETCEAITPDLIESLADIIDSDGLSGLGGALDLAFSDASDCSTEVQTAVVTSVGELLTAFFNAVLADLTSVTVTGTVGAGA